MYERRLCLFVSFCVYNMHLLAPFMSYRMNNILRSRTGHAQSWGRLAYFFDVARWMRTEVQCVFAD